MDSNFKIGDYVKWETNLYSVSVNRIGMIVAEIEVLSSINNKLSELKNDYKFIEILRDKEPLRINKSYLVLIKKDNGKSKLYWPDETILKKTENPYKIRKKIKKRIRIIKK